jgi:hypothetical protein
VRALVEGEPDPIANLANVAAELNAWLPDLNWVGFYLLKDGELVVGPFQGRPACTRIALGRGVCGTAAASGVSQLVPDVEAFPGHIACDARSRSEVVVPIATTGRWWPSSTSTARGSRASTRRTAPGSRRWWRRSRPRRLGARHAALRAAGSRGPRACRRQAHVGVGRPRSKVERRGLRRDLGEAGAAEQRDRRPVRRVGVGDDGARPRRVRP